MKIISQSIPHTYRNKRLKVRAYSLNTPSFTGGTHSHGNISILDIINSEDIDWVKTLKELIVLDGENIKIDTNLYTTGGITMFGNDGEVDIPTIYDGLPIDGITIFWEDGILKAAGGGEVVEITSEMITAALGYTPLQNIPSEYVTEAELANKQDIISDLATIREGAAKGATALQSQGFITGEGTGSAIVKDSKNCSATGDYSISGGVLANATGEASVALGRGCEASGRSSIALGGILTVLKTTGIAGATTYTTTSSINESFVGCDILLNDGVYNTKLATIQSILGEQFTVDKTLSAETDLNNVQFIVKGCKSTGSSSIALCNSLKSSGSGSYAEGYLTTATGARSHAEGYMTIASAQNSHAEGIRTIASANNAHAEGQNTIASGVNSHAEGGMLLTIYLTGNNKIYTINAGPYFQNSFFLKNAILNKAIVNSRINKVATIQSVVVAEDGYTVTVTLDADLGELNKDSYGVVLCGATGKYSHSENISVANGESSHAGGYSLANGNHSFAHGYSSVADGEKSAVFGVNNYTQNQSEFALGRSNHSHTGENPFEQTLFSVGCGTFEEIDMSNRIANQIPLPIPEAGANAIEVMQNGDVWLGGYSDGHKIWDNENKLLTLPIATVDNDGLMTAEDKIELGNISGKQDKLVSGTNIKTINGESILGSGDIGTYIDPNRMIVYTSTDGAVVTPGSSSDFGANIISNTYENGKGVILFDAPVTNIGYPAFHSCNTLKTIVLPQSVTWIGDSIFKNCGNLIDITIPDGVRCIEAWAFMYCGKLSKIIIPDKVTEIGGEVFVDCSSLEKVYCKAITPPVLGSYSLEFTASNLKIYVPYDSVDAYKSRWSDYADKIVGYHYDTGLLKTINGQSVVGEGDVTIKDISGNAASATKLQTARTIFGQSFDGTGNVDGDMTVTGNILTTGGVTMYSDRRLKTDIQPLKNRGYITPCSYVKDGEREIGFIAQDVKEIYPELVKEGEYLSLNYSQMTAILEAQIIELRNEIDDLKKELKQLKAE